MFGVYGFGQPYFGDAPSQSPAVLFPSDICGTSVSFEEVAYTVASLHPDRTVRYDEQVRTVRHCEN